MNDQPELENSAIEAAKELDAACPLREFRDQFHIPLRPDGYDEIYMVGNSLGLQPRRTADCVNEVLESWRTLGVRGHVESDFPWMPYHENLSTIMAKLVGAETNEVIIMNSLTVNLHLMMATFYRPTAKRNKILIERHAFPSDFFAVESQIRLHGFDPKECLIEVGEHNANQLVDHDELEKTIRNNRDELALILLPGVQYYTGQFFDMKRLTALANELEIPIGFDLAHAVGNVPMSLHDWDVDFAVWCSYKYLNSGPGSVGGSFVHEKHSNNTDKFRLTGWWGHDKATRFEMKNEFHAIPTAEGWQLSNPPILSLAAIRASLDVFNEAGGMVKLRRKSVKLTGHLEKTLRSEFGDQIRILTPTNPERRGCQLSLLVDFESGQSSLSGKEVHDKLEANFVRCDWREPNVIRVAPTPLYNSYKDVIEFVEILKEIRG